METPGFTPTSLFFTTVISRRSAATLATWRSAGPSEPPQPRCCPPRRSPTQRPSGTFDGVSEDSTVAALARWARRNKAAFFDEHGRHWIGTDRFCMENEYAYALEILAKQFSVDPGGSWLDAGGFDPRLTQVYRRFYQHAG